MNKYVANFILLSYLKDPMKRALLSLFYVGGISGFKGAKCVPKFHIANKQRNWDLKPDLSSLLNCGLSTHST